MASEQEWVNFDPNQPVQVAFTYAKGMEKEGQYGTWFYRKTVDGRPVKVPPIVEDKLKELGYKAKEQVVIEKCVQGKQTRWDVHRPGENGERRSEAERPLAGQPVKQSAAPASTVRKEGSESAGIPVGTLVTAYRNFLRQAIDLAIDATEYAKQKGYPLAFGAGEVQDLATSLYIQFSKEGNIRRMHDFREMEAETAAALAPKNGSDQEFSQAARSASVEKQQASNDPAEERQTQEPDWQPSDDDVPFS